MSLFMHLPPTQAPTRHAVPPAHAGAPAHKDALSLTLYSLLTQIMTSNSVPETRTVFNALGTYTPHSRTALSRTALRPPTTAGRGAHHLHKSRRTTLYTFTQVTKDNAYRNLRPHHTNALP